MIFTVSFAMPDAVALSQWIRAGGYGWTSSCKARRNIRPSFSLIKSDPNSDSDSDYDTILRMVNRAKDDPLRRIG